MSGADYHRAGNDSGVCNGASWSEPVKLSWWHAGGLHAHVTYPDGSTLHRIWKADHYWEVDSLRLELEHKYGKTNVQVSP